VEQLHKTGYMAVTGTTGRPTTPTVQGCFIGGQSGGHTAIELTASAGALLYIEFNQPNADFKGRFMYNNTNNDFYILC
jgi:hypothetical protein